MDDYPSGFSEEALRYRTEYAESRFSELLKRYYDGDDTVILEALNFAGSYNVPPPWWVMKAFSRIYKSVFGMKAKYRSWDEAFGSPHPKGKKLSTIRREGKCYAIFSEINYRRAKENKPSIDEALFQEVGERFGVGKTVCSDLYYRAKRWDEWVESTLAATEKTSGNP